MFVTVLRVYVIGIFEFVFEVQLSPSVAESKFWNKCDQLGKFSLFLLFLHFFSLFFAFFCFKFFASLWFSNFCFEAKQSEVKFTSIFSFFSLFSLFFAFFRFFCLIFVSLRFFRLIFAYFTFVFASDFWCFASKWIMWNQAFFSLPSETKFSLQFQISLPKRKWGRTLLATKCKHMICWAFA